MGDVEMDTGARSVRLDGREVELTSAEFDLLAHLLRSAGKTVSRGNFPVRAQAPSTSLERSIDVHISSLRRKLGHLRGDRERIRTIRGIGYLYTRSTNSHEEPFHQDIPLVLAGDDSRRRCIRRFRCSNRPPLASTQSGGTRSTDIGNDRTDVVGDAVRDGPSEVRRVCRAGLSPDETCFFVFSTEHPELSVDRAAAHVRSLIDKAQDDDVLHRAEYGDSFLYAKRVCSDEGQLVVALEAPQFEDLLSAAGDPRALGLRIVAVVLVGGLVCYWLARSITAPLRRLSAATSQLAQGDLSVRVGPDLVRRGDELAELGLAFNRMAGKIETLVAAQQQLLQDVSHELRSPLARLNVALALARRKAPPMPRAR